MPGAADPIHHLNGRNMRTEKLGMLMIAASILVITAIVGLTYQHQAKMRRAMVREQGQGLVRLLSRLPYTQLVPESGNADVLQAALQNSRGADLGYGAIVDLHGKTLVEVASAGTVVPPAPPSKDKEIMLGERTLSSPGNARPITEFYGPLHDGGKLVGQLRVGFIDGGTVLAGMEQPSYIALLALPIFLLVPLVYFVLKRELRPLNDIGRELRQLAASGMMPGAELSMSEDLRSFAEHFTRFAQFMQARIQQLEGEQFNSTVNNRLIAYRQEKLESLLHALPEAILVLDETANVTHANAKLDPILGVDHQSLIGKGVQELNVTPELAALLERCRPQSGQPFRGETLELSPDPQQERRIAVGAYPLFSPRETTQILGTLLVFRDITPDYLARRAGTEFVARVAHELKSPLNIMTMYSELLLSEAAEAREGVDPMHIEAVNVLRDEIERMVGLIDNLLNVTRLETGDIAIERHRVKLHDLLHDVFEEVKNNANGTDIRLQLEVPTEISPVLLDKNLFRIAVVNLLGNAIKYNRAGGSVLLSADENDSQVLVRVRDSGIGIPEADLPRVFERFFRSANAATEGRSGHGLGLYLAKQITELHQGSITVTSELGKGTEFCMQFRKLPAIIQEAAQL